MKKMMVTGALAAALIVSGGTGYYFANATRSTASSSMLAHHQGVNVEQMTNQIKSGDASDRQNMMQSGNATFEQMKPFMKKMHPNLSDKELEELFNSMHGAGGACGVQNGSTSNPQNQSAKGMMGNNL